MSKKIRKIFTYLLLTVLAVVGLGNVANSVAEAAGPTTNVVITKVDTEATAAEREYDISQPITDLGAHFGQAAVPLEGVSFTYYSVTADQLETLTAAPASYDTVAEVDALLGVEDTGTTTGETDTNGQVTISNLPEGNYWVVENTKGTIASSAAVPFGLTLPFTNADGTGYYETIHVYPKNTLEDYPGVEKTVDKDNVAIGQTNTWTVGLDVPKGIEDYEKFGFADEIDSRLDFQGVDTVTATAEGINLVKGTDYTVQYHVAAEGTVGKHGLLAGKTIEGTLEVQFTDDGRIKLANVTGSKVNVTLETKVNDTAIMGDPINNTVALDFDNGHGYVSSPGEPNNPDDPGKNPDPDDPEGPVTPEETPSVHTGGKGFIKEDSVTDATLDGAEFVIKNGDQFVNVAENSVTFVDSRDDATVFTSEDAGYFEIKGLPYGTYTLVEIKAPKGYALPTNPETEFEVDAGSYDDNNELPIPNVQLTIPQTGGMGTAIFTVIGVALMTISVVSYKRTSEA